MESLSQRIKDKGIDEFLKQIFHLEEENKILKE